MSDNIVLVREPDEIRIEVEIGVGYDLIQLPNGFAYTAGDLVELTIAQFDQLNINLFHGATPVLVNNGPVERVTYDGEEALVYRLGSAAITELLGGAAVVSIDLITAPDFGVDTWDYALAGTATDTGTTVFPVGPTALPTASGVSWSVDGGASTGVAVITEVVGGIELSFSTPPVATDAFDLTARYGTLSDTITISVVDTT